MDLEPQKGDIPYANETSAVNGASLPSQWTARTGREPVDFETTRETVLSSPNVYVVTSCATARSMRVFAWTTNVVFARGV